MAAHKQLAFWMRGFRKYTFLLHWMYNNLCTTLDTTSPPTFSITGRWTSPQDHTVNWMRYFGAIIAVTKQFNPVHSLSKWEGGRSAFALARPLKAKPFSTTAPLFVHTQLSPQGSLLSLPPPFTLRSLDSGVGSSFGRRRIQSSGTRVPRGLKGLSYQHRGWVWVGGEERACLHNHVCKSIVPWCGCQNCGKSTGFAFRFEHRKWNRGRNGLH